MSNHEDLQAVAVFVAVALACFFGFLTVPLFPSPLNWNLASGSVIVILIAGVTYFSWCRFAKRSSRNPQIPPAQAQDWIHERINVVTIDRWIPNPVRTFRDGTTNYSGTVITGSDRQTPENYDYNIRMRERTIMPNQSSIIRNTRILVLTPTYAPAGSVVSVSGSGFSL